MKAYPAYRASGIPWAPTLPADWAAEPSRSIAVRVRREPRDSDEIITAFRDGQVTLRTNRRTTGFTEAFQEIGYQGIRKGDLVIHAMDAFAGAIGISDADGKTTPVVHAYRVRDSDARYVAYLLRLASSSGYIQALAKGIRERSTSFDATMFKSLRLPVPNFAEQTAIANYLDRETAQIDALIEKQQQLIAALRERLSSRIASVITSGLRAHADTVADAERSLGARPAHWEVCRIKDVGRATIGLTYEPADIVNPEDGGTLVLRAGNVQDGRIVLGDDVWVRSFIPPVLRVRAGDILICSRNGSARLIGKNAMLDASIEGQTWGAFMTVLRSPLNSYLHWILNSPMFAAQAGLYSTSTINQLTSAALHGMRITIPPEAERKEIVEYLRDYSANVNSFINAAQRLIFLSRERRSAVITAAVTGQIDVRTV